MHTYKNFDFEPNQYPNKNGFFGITKEDFRHGIYNPEFEVEFNDMRMINDPNSTTQTIID